MTDLQKQRIVDSLMYNTLLIEFFDGTQTITEDNIASESMTLKQSLCDEDKLKFGGCVASSFSIQLVNTEERTFSPSELTDKWITVRMIQTAPTGEYVYPGTIYPGTTYPGEIVEDYEFIIFSGYIDTIERDKSDDNTFNLTAYDVIAKLYESDATDFLADVLAGRNKTLEYMFRRLVEKDVNLVSNVDFDGIDSYFNEVLSNQITVGETTIINNNWLNSDKQISFGEILKNICELLGVFGFIEPGEHKGGVFVMKNPFVDSTSELYDFFEELTIQDKYNVQHYYDVIKIAMNYGTKSKSKNIYPENGETGSEIYDMTDNILAQEESESDNRLQYLLKSGYGCHTRITGYGTSNRLYYPVTAVLDGRLWVKLGTQLTIEKYKTDVNGDYKTNDDGEFIKETYKTFMLSRTITGIQALTDTIETKG